MRNPRSFQLTSFNHRAPSYENYAIPHTSGETPCDTNKKLPKKKPLFRNFATNFPLWIIFVLCAKDKQHHSIHRIGSLTAISMVQRTLNHHMREFVKGVTHTIKDGLTIATLPSISSDLIFHYLLKSFAILPIRFFACWWLPQKTPRLVASQKKNLLRGPQVIIRCAKSRANPFANWHLISVMLNRTPSLTHKMY